MSYNRFISLYLRCYWDNDSGIITPDIHKKPSNIITITRMKSTIPLPARRTVLNSLVDAMIALTEVAARVLP